MRLSPQHVKVQSTRGPTEYVLVHRRAYGILTILTNEQLPEQDRRTF